MAVQVHPWVHLGVDFSAMTRRFGSFVTDVFCLPVDAVWHCSLSVDVSGGHLASAVHLDRFVAVLAGY
jgi:hypothetical protein